MGKWTSSRREELVSAMELPRDLVDREALLSLTGRTQLCVENYRTLLEYQENHILILTKNGRIAVGGRHLEILYYTNEELLIKGDIHEILFLE